MCLIIRIVQTLDKVGKHPKLVDVILSRNISNVLEDYPDAEGCQVDLSEIVEVRLVRLWFLNLLNRIHTKHGPIYPVLLLIEPLANGLIHLDQLLMVDFHLLQLEQSRRQLLGVESVRLQGQQ